MGIREAVAGVIVRGERLQRTAATEMVFGIPRECPGMDNTQRITFSVLHFGHLSRLVFDIKK